MAEPNYTVKLNQTKSIEYELMKSPVKPDNEEYKDEKSLLEAGSKGRV